MNNVFKKRTWMYARSFAIDFGLAVIPVNTNCILHQSSLFRWLTIVAIYFVSGFVSKWL